MEINLLDPGDDSSSPIHLDTLKNVNEFINSHESFMLDKAVVTGVIKVPEGVNF